MSADDLKYCVVQAVLLLLLGAEWERKGCQAWGKIMDDIIKDFLIESNENLDRLDQELVKLETDPTSRELLDSIFRTIHTIKGSCGFLGFSRLEKVAHAGESLLSKLREGQLTLNSEITSGLLAMVDAVRRMLTEIQATEQDGNNDYPELLAQLKALQQPSQQSEPEAVPSPAETAPPPADEIRIIESSSPPEPNANAEVQEASPEAPEAPLPPEPVPHPDKLNPDLSEHFKPFPSKIGGLLVNRGSIGPNELALALQEQERGDRRRVGEILVSLGFCKQEDINTAQQALENRAHQAGVETVRVGVDLLDMLMNLVGELVLARNQLLQASNSLQDVPLQSVSQRMNLIVTEVQQQVMKTRMQPIGNVWNKFPRTVRDLALSCGKEVQLEMHGQDTELDRTIIEAIKDPLTHLVRNAIDHGIEAPDARRSAGKDPAGRLTLRAFHEGGRVKIEIQDDGAGLNVDRLLKKAIERGLVQEHQAKTMAERDVFNLIFLPGFSTAEKVTKVSGRGVGMDVVKTNVEKIGGAIDIQSSLGVGTTVSVSIPLTLAIVPALIVNCRSDRFAIPQVNVLELVGLETGKEIEQVHGAPVYRLRGDLLPLVHLDRELQLSPVEGNQQVLGSIIVLQAESHQFGLVVDDILDTEEIVVKPLSEQLKGINTFSGATIMGDGRVALILDVLGLGQKARVVSDAHEAMQDRKVEVTQASASQAQSLLLMRNGVEGQVAIPLSAVSRLEGFLTPHIQKIGQTEAMEYRGSVIPLVRLSQYLPADTEREPVESKGSMEVVIYSHQGRTVGVIVDCIVDIIEQQGAIDPLALRSGVVGSFVTENNITELLDLPSIVASALPALSEFSEAASAGS